MFRLILAAIAIGVITYMIRRRLLQRLAATSPVVPPSALSYTSPSTFTEDAEITPLSPTISGDSPFAYAIDPALPAGLSIHATTGVISGTPTTATAADTYTVTATNSAGNTTADLDITVEAAVFVPTDIVDLVQWLKADSIAGVDNDAITTWEDSGAENNDVTQATAGLKPTLKTNIVNGLPVARFSGDRLVAAGAIFDLTKKHTLYAVAKEAAVHDGTIMATHNGAVGVFWRFRSNGGTPTMRFGIPVVDAVSGLTPGTFGVITIILDAASGAAGTLKMRIDGVEIYSAAWTRSAGHDGLQTIGAIVGGGADLVGDIAELLTYEGAHTGDDLTNVETYLQTKYAL